MSDAFLAIERGPRGSVVARAHARSPLALRTPHNHGHAAWVFTSSHGGGLVAGDDVRLSVSVGEDAALVLATQASTKVYRSPPGGAADPRLARLETDVSVDRGGLACLLPDPLVAFRDARLAQRACIHLREGGSAIVWDPVGAGRVSRGERWDFQLLETHVTIDGPGGRILTESTRLCPAESRAFADLGAFDAFGVLVLIGPRLAPMAGALLGRTRGDPASHDGLLFTASPLLDGAILRVAAPSTAALLLCVRSWLRELPDLLGDDFFARRSF